MNINKAAGSLARYLAVELQATRAQEEVLAYGLELLFLGAMGLIAVALGGYLVGAPSETLFALLCASLVRLPGGGMHLSSPGKCLSFTALIFSIMGFLARRLSEYLFMQQHIAWVVSGSGLLSLAISAWLTPVTSPAKPINSPVLRRKLHRLAVGISLIVPVILLFMRGQWPSLALAGAVGLAWQAAIIYLASLSQNKEVKPG
ncbi:Accessory gene regulator B [Moorella glycerini]|uniref:Accessory protein regulator protein n=1 Tax=Neomoorella stamsii TaxID=1266720 RepID=A0A9X7J224_9FIRM|nr:MULTISPECIES: accessory gene regulator B family protein [Moorella]PRR71749.1 putative accessory protein regulator protein [Moorella stamsii]CEP67208.1 Accessory gene regulator B [Moorella glycerini]